MIHGSNPGRGKRFFSFLRCPVQLWGPHSLCSGCQDCFPGVKWPEHEVDHSFLVSRLRMIGALPYTLTLQGQTWVLSVLCTSKAKVNIPCKALEKPWGFQEVEAPKISRQLAHEASMVVSCMHRLPLHGRKYSWYSFLLEAGRPWGQSVARRVMSIKIPKTPLKMEPVTYWLAAHCLNQLHHHVPPYSAQDLGFKWRPITLCFLGQWLHWTFVFLSIMLCVTSSLLSVRKG